MLLLPNLSTMFPQRAEGIRLWGRYDGEVWDTRRDPVSGLLVPARLVRRFRSKNLVPDAAITQMFNVYFNATTPIVTWYMGLIDNVGWSAVAAGDTMASHAGWVEFTTYNETTRPAWGQGAAVAKVITNSASVIFTMSSGGPWAVRGGFITSASNKSGTSGTLWSGGAFSSGVQNLLATQQLKLTYTLSGASS